MLLFYLFKLFFLVSESPQSGWFMSNKVEYFIKGLKLYIKPFLAMIEHTRQQRPKCNKVCSLTGCMFDFWRSCLSSDDKTVDCSQPLYLRTLHSKENASEASAKHTGVGLSCPPRYYNPPSYRSMKATNTDCRPLWYMQWTMLCTVFFCGMVQNSFITSLSY